LSALQKLIQAGKIAHWGISNYASWQIVDMERICARSGLSRPTTAQQIYNLLVRQLDVEYWAFARQHPIHTTVYNPLAGGLLGADVCARIDDIHRAFSGTDATYARLD